MTRKLLLTLAIGLTPMLATTACGAASPEAAAPAAAAPAQKSFSAFNATEFATFDEPWAMTFVPGTRAARVTAFTASAFALWSAAGKGDSHGTRTSWVLRRFDQTAVAGRTGRRWYRLCRHPARH